MNGVVNLVGMGSALVGLQAALGSLLSKTLTAAPGLWGVTYRAGGGPPVALDIFSVQVRMTYGREFAQTVCTF